MPAETLDTLKKLKGDLTRCIASAEWLGQVAIAIYLQRALDEMNMLQG
jgi:hypothetical protein